MSLTVRVGDDDLTAVVSNIRTKNVAVGGFGSVIFDVKRKLDQSLFDTFTDAMTFDPETGEQTGGGRLLEQGRNDDGTWQVTCLGEGLASMQDVTTPVAYVDGDLSNWYVSSKSTKRFSASVGEPPDGNSDITGLAFEGQEGVTLVNTAQITMFNRVAELCGMSLGGVGFIHKAGTTNANWELRARVFVSDLSGSQTPITDTFSVSWSARRLMVTSADFSSGIRTVAGFQWRRTSDKTGAETDWNFVRDPIIRTQIYGTDGNLRTTGYTNEYILPHEVLIDWVVRHCPRLEIGDITTTSTEQIEQMAYLDGVHGMQLAEDVREREPALIWQVWEKNAATGLWPFHYVPLTTEIQYEASVDDGFSAPSPSSEIYDEVVVTGQTASGRDVKVLRTSTVPSLDAAGFSRRATIPLGSEVWSTTAANKVGDEFLAEHATPPNAGTITIARPIYDNLSGRWIKPCNIRSGGLMRVRGIQPTPDTLNATSPDGVTVFRVVSATFNNDTNSTVCELDAYALTEARAIAKLARARTRR